MQAANDLEGEVRALTALGDLAVAYFYAQRNLKAEALQLLAGRAIDVPGLATPPASHLRSWVSDSPVLYLRLGDLFADSRIRLCAEKAYHHAVELAEKSGDLESQAVAWVEVARPGD